MKDIINKIKQGEKDLMFTDLNKFHATLEYLNNNNYKFKVNGYGSSKVGNNDELIDGYLIININ